MRYSSLRLAGVCFAGVTLWLFLLYFLNDILRWPVWLSYGSCALLGAALLYYVLQRHLHALQYQRLFDEHPIPMWIYQRGSLRFLAVNNAAVDKYGYSRKEFLNMTIKDIRDPQEVNRLLINIREHCNGARYRGIWKHRKKDGTDFYTELYAHDGVYMGAKTRIIMAVDVDEQVRESHEVRELGIRYELLAKATKDAIYDWDIINDTVTWNHGLYTLFGHQPNDATNIRDWWARRLHPEDKERMMLRLQQQLDSGAMHYEERYRLLCANGRYKNVLCRGYMVHENSTATRMIGLIQDIDHIVEKQQIIRRLQDQHKGLREIAWINSHEIRKPVVSILGITRLFDRSNENRSLNNQLIEWLYTSTSELDEIIHKLEEKVREIENGSDN